MENKMKSVDHTDLDKMQLNKYVLIQLKNMFVFIGSLWIGIYLFVGIILTSVFVVLLSLVTTNINVQQLNQISKAGLGKRNRDISLVIYKYVIRTIVKCSIIISNRSLWREYRFNERLENNQSG